MAVNYTLQDMLGMVQVLPFFAIVLLAPGYLTGIATNVLAFRRRGIAERILLSLTLSCAVAPYIINLLCRFLSVRAVSILFLVPGLAFLTAIAMEWRRAGFKLEREMHGSTKAAISMVALWGAVCLVSLPDLQLGHSIYSTAATWDHAVRSAFIASAMREGAPPANPFFFAGTPVHSRYYYYWNVLCAIPTCLSGVTARIALYGSCFWSGLCLMAIIPIYLKHFIEGKSELRRTTVFGFALLAITGLDLIPTTIIALFRATPPYADMEWWDPVQSASWLDSLIWVPHHIASLVACLAGFLFLWNAVGVGDRWRRLSLLVLSAIGFSSAAGLSVYVMFNFALFIVAWVAYLLVRGRVVAALLHVISGLLAVLLSCGYLGDLLGRGATTGAGTASFVAFTLRELPNLFSPFVDVLGHNHRLVATCLYLVFLLLTMFLEYGVYFAVGYFQWKQDWKRRRELPEAQKCLWFMVGATLVVVTFLRSTVIGANDLAWRSSMVLQFVLLLWTASYLAERVVTRRDGTQEKQTGGMKLSSAFVVLLLIGGASSFYQLFMLRSYAFLSDKYKWDKVIHLSTGPEAYLIREAYAELDRATPSNAIVQFNPASNLTNQFLIYSRYQQADVFPPGCATPFGGSLETCHIVDAQLNRVFNPANGDSINKAEAGQICRSLRIDRLLVSAQDPIWNMPGSWVWEATPTFHNDFVRVYRCDFGF